MVESVEVFYCSCTMLGESRGVLGCKNGDLPIGVEGK